MKKKKNDTVFIKKQKRRLRRKNKDGNKDIDKSGGVVFLMSFWIRRMVRRNFFQLLEPPSWAVPARREERHEVSG